MKRVILLILCTLFLLCGCTQKQNSNEADLTTGQDEKVHSHTPVEQRQADRFFVFAEEQPEVTEYSICYEEPDGCITSVVTMGNYEQSFIIHDVLIYYVERAGGCRLCAIDFAGNVQKAYQLEEIVDNAWLLYNDDEYIYGAGGFGLSNNATYIFQVDWDLNECKRIDAYPKQYRQLDYDKVGNDFAELCQADIGKIYVHGANALFDANGMAYEMLIMVSAVSETDTISGNLLLGWYNQLPAYDTWGMNPWFNKVEEGYGSIEGLMTLSDFLAQLKGMEDNSVIPENLPSGEKPFRLTFGIGIPEELPIADNAVTAYIDLADGAVNEISQLNAEQDYFTIVAKSSNSIIGVLHILVDDELQ